jgi:membrane protease YdiL (CAAX protease family)
MAAGSRARSYASGYGGVSGGPRLLPRPLLWTLGAYLAVAAGSASLALAFGRDPLSCNAWLGTSGHAAVLVSLGIGVCVGGVTVAATRVLVRRTAWARALHSELRPAVEHAGDGWLVAVAAASALGEELLFRGLLVPTIGVVLQAVVFGALHQVRGRGRWGWMMWATLMGLLFGGIFALTGSLVGPLAAHGIINGQNLRFLRDNDPSRPQRPLGGLLRRP